MDFGFTAIGTITIICYLVAQAVKATPLDNKWLPTIVGALGGILGVLGVGIMPDFPVKDSMTAIALGIVSGLAATGSNQIYKQLFGTSADGTIDISDNDSEKGDADV